MKQVIPVMFCFDKNYVIPAAVAFYSLLEHANKDYFYKFYVLHSDISKEQQEELNNTLKPFQKYYSLEFRNMQNRLDDAWKKLKTKVHFSKEVFYKMLVGSMFPEYDKIIVSDVDVVFLGDISPSYFSLKENDENYVAAIKPIEIVQNFDNVYNKNFTEEEIKKLISFCGGYLVFNLKKIRADKMEERFLNCLYEKAKLLIFAEQDVLNLCCYGKTKFLPLNYVTCTYTWDFYKTKKDMRKDKNYTYKEIKDAMDNPIQLHYASKEKPWKYVDCTKSEIWFEYLVKTTFLKQYLKQLPYMVVTKKYPKTKNHQIVKEIKHAFEYLKMEPLFLFKPSFYRRVKNKIAKMKKK